MFTVFLRGRGGKGVATSLGVALALAPLAGLLSFALYIAVYALLRVSALGSLLGVWSFPLLTALFGQAPAVHVVLGVVVACLVTLRHRENITRLLRRHRKIT
jgi:glycerol-3-phosphate acyltransferase PlsY